MPSPFGQVRAKPSQDQGSQHFQYGRWLLALGKKCDCDKFPGLTWARSLVGRASILRFSPASTAHGCEITPKAARKAAVWEPCYLLGSTGLQKPLEWVYVRLLGKKWVVMLSAAWTLTVAGLCIVWGRTKRKGWDQVPFLKISAAHCRDWEGLFSSMRWFERLYRYWDMDFFCQPLKLGIGWEGMMVQGAAVNHRFL